MLLDDVVTVTDDGIIRAMRWAFEYLKIMVEPSGTFRALMAGLPDVTDRAVA